MITKETCRQLFNKIILDNGSTVDNDMFVKDADTIFNWFYTLMKSAVDIEVRRREEALLECHRLKQADEQRLLALIRTDRNKKIEFMYGLEESARRPDVFREPYIRALMDVLFKYKDLHPEIKPSDLEGYMKKLNTNTDPIIFNDNKQPSPTESYVDKFPTEYE